MAEGLGCAWPGPCLQIGLGSERGLTGRILAHPGGWRGRGKGGRLALVLQVYE